MMKILKTSKSMKELGFTSANNAQNSASVYYKVYETPKIVQLPIESFPVHSSATP